MLFESNDGAKKRKRPRKTPPGPSPSVTALNLASPAKKKAKQEKTLKERMNLPIAYSLYDSKKEPEKDLSGMVKAESKVLNSKFRVNETF